MAVWKAQMSEMMVDLPEPEEPTRAVTVPGLRLEADAVEDGLAGLVGEGDVLEAICHRSIVGRSVTRVGSRSSSRSARISLVRSRPARASVSWVPIETSWTMGAIMKARNMT